MAKAFMTVFVGTRNACLAATALTKCSKTKFYNLDISMLP
jgi:hypothetical protein